MTVKQAVNAYQVLRDLDPSVLGEDLTNEVMDAISDLEPAAHRFQRKADAHRERLTEDDETDEEGLEGALESLMEEEADVQAKLNLSKAPSTGILYDLRSQPALQPLVNGSSTNES